MKKKKFSAVKAIKDKARRVIGSPKPTAVRSGRKSGASRTSLDPALNQPNVAADPHYTPREEYIEGAPRLSRTEELHIKTPVILRKPREGPRPKTAVLHYSKEVIDHINVLRASQGEQAAQDYLTHLREKTMHSDIAERLTRANSETAVDGSITAALKDAELKVAFFENETKRCQAEAERWRQIALNLKNAIKLTVGEVSMPKPKTGEKRERGYWAQKVRSVLSRDPHPMPRVELQKLLIAEEECAYPTVYAALKSLIDTDVLVDLDGKIALPEWTDPK